MVLAAAVALGLVAGFFRAWVGKRSYRVVSLRFPGLVLIAFIPQWFAFYQTRMGAEFPAEFSPALLVLSQSLLLVFAWFNRKLPGFWLLGGGLLLNLLVIAANGGLMPISPETVRVLYPQAPASSWEVGKQLGNGKDIVLPREETNLWFLSDRFLFPEWLRYPVAYSLGDVVIALGAFWLLWTLGGESK
jgi:hypothetical protein